MYHVTEGYQKARMIAAHLRGRASHLRRDPDEIAVAPGTKNPASRPAGTWRIEWPFNVPACVERAYAGAANSYALGYEAGRRDPSEETRNCIEGIEANREMACP